MHLLTKTSHLLANMVNLRRPTLSSR